MRFPPPTRFAPAAALGLVLALAAVAALALDPLVADITVQDLGDFGFDVQGTDSPASENGVLGFDGGVSDELFQVYGYLGTATGPLRIDSTSFDVASAMGSHPDVRTTLEGTSSARIDTAAIPEPALLTGLGLVGLAFYGRRRRASRR